jgi:hypothetical protein
MADTNRGRLAYVAESVFGTTPTDPDFQILRLVSSDLTYNKETTQSNELDSSRMLTDVPEVAANIQGSINIEWSPVTYDDLIEAVLGGTKSTAIASGAGSAAISFSTPTATVTDTGAFANVEVGQWLLFTGWSNSGNNGWKRVVTNADNDTITITDTGMVTEAAGGSGQIRGSTIKNGTTERSFSLEEAYTDLDLLRLFQGQRASMMSMSFSPGAILTGSFGFMGTTVLVADDTADAGTQWYGSGSRTAANTYQVLNSTSNVGDIFINGTLSTACFKMFDLNIDNTLRNVQCVGNKFPGSINYGRQVVSGSLTKLFADWTTLYDKMLAHEDISISLGAYNSSGGIHIHLPRVTLSSDAVNLSGGIDSDVDEPVNWSALKYEDTTLNEFYQIRIDIAGT